MKKNKSKIAISGDIFNQMVEKKIKKRLVIYPIPIDRISCACYGLIKQTMYQNSIGTYKEGMPHIECPLVERNNINAKKWAILCKSCNEMLAYFYNAKPILDERYFDLHVVEWNDLSTWYGCLGCNVNLGMINFECCCGECLVKDQALNINRYCEYKIVAYQDKFCGYHNDRK